MSAKESSSPLDPQTPDLGGAMAVESFGMSLDLLREVPMPVAVEIGRTEMTVHEILQLGMGSVVTLDRIVGEPVDVFVGSRKLAQGEVVALGENLGVRITRLVGARGGESSS